MFLLSKNYFQIKKTSEKGLGVFAKKEIKAGTIIGDYLGKIIKISEYDLDQDKNGLFLMFVSDEAAIYPDLDKAGIHLINHSCTPNCWIYLHKGHTLFFAIRNIKAGEELTISYLLSPKSKYCDPCTHDCKCENKLCTGTMHLSQSKYDLWQEFQNEQEKKEFKKLKFVFGRNLPKLKTYPKTIPVDPIYSIICPN